MFGWHKYAIASSSGYTDDMGTPELVRQNATPINMEEGYTSYSFDFATGEYTLTGELSDLSFYNVVFTLTESTLYYYSHTPWREYDLCDIYRTPHTASYHLDARAGTYIEDVTSESNTTYPADGIQDGYWYTYIGVIIDAPELSYSTPIVSGENVELSALYPEIEGDNPIVTFEKSVNSNVWLSIGSNPLAITVLITESAGSTIAFRCKIISNYNGESAYDVSPALTVLQRPSVPASITYGEPEYHHNLTISWGTSTVGSGLTATYYLEKSVNSGTWTAVDDTTSTSYSYYVTEAKDATIAFRVKCSDGTLASAYRTGSTETVVINSSAKIWDDDNTYDNSIAYVKHEGTWKIAQGMTNANNVWELTE